MPQNPAKSSLLVSQLKAGQGIKLSPENGTGVVTVAVESDPLTTAHMGGLTATSLAVTGPSTLSTTQISVLTATTLGQATTAIMNGVALVSCQVGTVSATSVAFFGLKTAGGTVGTPKMATPFDPSTGKFCVASTASDTSTYNVAVLG